MALNFDAEHADWLNKVSDKDEKKAKKHVTFLGKLLRKEAQLKEAPTSGRKPLPEGGQWVTIHANGGGKGHRVYIYNGKVLVGNVPQFVIDAMNSHAEEQKTRKEFDSMVGGAETLHELSDKVPVKGLEAVKENIGKYQEHEHLTSQQKNKAKEIVTKLGNAILGRKQEWEAAQKQKDKEREVGQKFSNFVDSFGPTSYHAKKLSLASLINVKNELETWKMSDVPKVANAASSWLGVINAIIEEKKKAQAPKQVAIKLGYEAYYNTMLPPDKIKIQDWHKKMQTLSTKELQTEYKWYDKKMAEGGNVKAVTHVKHGILKEMTEKGQHTKPSAFMSPEEKEHIKNKEKAISKLNGKELSDMTKWVDKMKQMSPKDLKAEYKWYANKMAQAKAGNVNVKPITEAKYHMLKEMTGGAKGTSVTFGGNSNQKTAPSSYKQSKEYGALQDSSKHLLDTLYGKAKSDKKLAQEMWNEVKGLSDKLGTPPPYTAAKKVMLEQVMKEFGLANGSNTEVPFDYTKVKSYEKLDEYDQSDIDEWYEDMSNNGFESLNDDYETYKFNENSLTPKGKAKLDIMTQLLGDTAPKVDQPKPGTKFNHKGMLSYIAMSPATQEKFDEWVDDIKEATPEEQKKQYDMFVKEKAENGFLTNVGEAKMEVLSHLVQTSNKPSQYISEGNASTLASQLKSAGYPDDLISEVINQIKKHGFTMKTKEMAQQALSAGKITKEQMLAGGDAVVKMISTVKKENADKLKEQEYQNELESDKKKFGDNAFTYQEKEMHHKFIGSWYGSSTNMTSMALRLAISQLGMSKARMESALHYTGQTLASVKGTLQGLGEQLMHATVKKTHARTQHFLNNVGKGQKTVTLYRGVHNSELKSVINSHGAAVYQPSPLESWSTRPHAAHNFGNIVMRIEVPIEQVLWNHQTRESSYKPEHEWAVMPGEKEIKLELGKNVFVGLPPLEERKKTNLKNKVWIDSLPKSMRDAYEF